MNMTAQYIETPTGDRLVIISEKEYQALRLIEEEFEDARDAAEVEAQLQRLRAGDEETFPSELIHRLHEGTDHPIKIYREYRGLKSMELADIVGITPSYLSEIEHRKKDGTLKLCMNIARALQVDLDDLVEWPRD
jgi:DNA-binding XRE family transcriptional regulator